MKLRVSMFLTYIKLFIYTAILYYPAYLYTASVIHSVRYLFKLFKKDISNEFLTQFLRIYFNYSMRNIFLHYYLLKLNCATCTASMYIRISKFKKFSNAVKTSLKTQLIFTQCDKCIESNVLYAPTSYKELLNKAFTSFNRIKYDKF